MIVRSLLRTILRPTPRFFYSTTPPAGSAPSFKFPRRWQMKVAAYNQVSEVIQGLTQYKQFANFLRDNLIYFTDQHLGELYTIFKHLDLELDNNFYDFILPITKQYIKKYTFQDTESLSEVIIGSLALNVQDDQFWELVLQKLYNEKCYKYISVPKVLKITEGFLANPRLNTHPVVAEFGKILGQQKGLLALYDGEKANKAEALSSRIQTFFKDREPEKKLLEQQVKKINS